MVASAEPTATTSDQPVPGLVIAALGSGSGKTTIATGLMAVLAATYDVAAFKVGPDYIDPSYHRLATGHAARNLDSVLCGTELIGPLYAHGSQGCDLSVVEGVMGLFDGRIAPATAHSADTGGGDASLLAAGSTAEIAALLGIPVIVVVDVRGMSHTVGPLLHGLAIAHPQVRIAGVILNKAGSDRHAAVCRSAIEAYGIPVLGSIPRVDAVAVPSRHLGLITSGELAQAHEAIAAMADLVRRHVDLEALVALAACRNDAMPWSPEQAVAAAIMSAPHSDDVPAAPKQSPVSIALAAGPAFSFSYAEHIELLEALGVNILSFDPLHEDLPAASGLIIPGGFPEEYCEQLSQQPCQASIREAIEAGLPVHAECAGLLWLLHSLSGHPMVGALPLQAEMARLSLGYREAVALQDSVVYGQGQRVIGHEFHHTQVTAVPGTEQEQYPAAWAWRGWAGQLVQEGCIAPNIHASYLHVHPAAYPQSVVRFVEHCRTYQERRAAQ